MTDDLNVDFVPELSLLINQSINLLDSDIGGALSVSAGQLNKNLEALDAY